MLSQIYSGEEAFVASADMAKGNISFDDDSSRLVLAIEGGSATQLTTTTIARKWWFSVEVSGSSRIIAMHHLRWIEISGFKGIRNLRCDFEGLTLLAGVNNSGKTSVLQAIQLVLTCLERMLTRLPGDWKLSENAPQLLREIGIMNSEWVLPNQGKAFRLRGELASDHVIEVTHRNNNFEIAVENFTHNQDGLRMDRKVSFFRPPGIVAAKEPMLQPPEFNRQVAEGNSQTVWRNIIWWSLQEEGLESFESVQRLVESHFPGVKLRVPRLGNVENPAQILIEYEEAGRNEPKLDIAQSGAGLHTFMSLAQVIEQSNAQVILLDEPDTHLHASQQEVVVRLLSEVAESEGRQVVLATHSPELIARVPDHAIRWLVPGQNKAEGAERLDIYDQLGVATDAYLPMKELPEVIVYVEGSDDKPIVERIIEWCRRKHGKLPSTAVVHHKDGRFDGPALQAISRVTRSLGSNPRIVGIRDLDWFYGDVDNLIDGLPTESLIRENENYTLVTLACKEMENLFCRPEHLRICLDNKHSLDELQDLVEKLSRDEGLIEEWMNRAKPRIRERFDAKLAEATIAENTKSLIGKWREDFAVRLRYVRGKRLLSSIRRIVKLQLGVQLPSNLLSPLLDELGPDWQQLAETIFPEINTTNSDVE